jgi:asparaginyl-tRNA synthetase
VNFIKSIDKSIYDVIDTTEQFLDRLLNIVKLICGKEFQIVDREFIVPSIPFPRVTYSELYDIATSFDDSLSFGDDIPWEVLEEISMKSKKPFWVLDYPVGSRDFYYKEDPDRDEILLTMDLIYPEGYGEASRGGERETDVKKIIKNLRETGEKFTEYNWYLEMMENDGQRSSGLGIGIERLTRYILGIEDINQCTAFPKRPGSFSI